MSVASTYAEALYEAAAEGDVVPAVAQDLDDFLSAMEVSPELHDALVNPEIDTPRKRAVVNALGAEAQPLVRNFLLVLIDRGRMSELPEITRAFAARVAQAEDILAVEAITAVPLPDDLRERIVERIQEQSGRRVWLEERLDPEVVGGLVLNFGDVVVDASVRNRLDGLRRALTQARVETTASPS